MSSAIIRLILTTAANISLQHRTPAKFLIGKENGLSLHAAAKSTTLRTPSATEHDGFFLAGIQWEGRYPTVVPLQPSGVSNQDQCKISPELIISPNPARNRTLKLQLQGISAHAPCVVELADVIGQKIPIEQPINLTETKNGATAELVAEGIPAGVYFLQLQIGEKSMVELLVLE